MKKSSTNNKHTSQKNNTKQFKWNQAELTHLQFMYHLPSCICPSSFLPSFVTIPKKQSTKQDTTILLHHPYILYHFANYAHHKTFYMYISLMHNSSFTHIYMALSTAYSTAFCVQGNQPCWAAIRVHNITHTPTYNTDLALLMHSTASVYTTDLSAMLSSCEVAATHNITHSPCTTCTTHSQHCPLCTAFHTQVTVEHKAWLAKWHKIYRDGESIAV